MVTLDPMPIAVRRIAQSLVGLSILIIVVASIILFLQSATYFNPFPFGPLFGTVSSVILVGLFGLYRYAYKFYWYEFCNFSSVCWLRNTVYILIACFIRPTQADFKNGLKVYGMRLITLFPI